MIRWGFTEWREQNANAVEGSPGERLVAAGNFGGYFTANEAGRAAMFGMDFQPTVATIDDIHVDAGLNLSDSARKFVGSRIDRAWANNLISSQRDRFCSRRSVVRRYGGLTNWRFDRGRRFAPDRQRRRLVF